MSYFVGGAIIVGAVGSAVSSNKASKENAKGVKKGLDQSAALAQQARDDVMKLFDRSSRNSALGLKGALDFYRTAAPKRLTPFLQANQQAQNVIGQGAIQANNAILGLPTDMSFTQQAQVQPNTDYMLGAQMPDYSMTMTEELAEPEVVPGVQPQAKQMSKSKAIKKELDSHSIGKKVLKKLF